LTDGLVWNLLLDGDVNTLAFRNVAGTDPFLWGGILPTLFDFSREVLRLVGAEASGSDMELLTEYMQSVTAPPNPYTLPGGRFTPEALRGKALFESGVGQGGAGCTACHSGPLLTNRAVVAGKTAGMRTDVPSLIGVYDTGPWGRLGQWTTLDEMVDFALGFTGAELAPADRDAVLAYVRQLPGDLLYLTSARPLSGSRNVFHQIDIELAFSAPLSSGQADHFHFERAIDAGFAPMPGNWRLSGRYARYEGQPLPLDSQFRIRIDAGLAAPLGASLQGPLELTFSTGPIAEIDCTGHWYLDVLGPVAGTAELALLQTSGGHVAGALLDGAGLIDLDHLEGFVSGTTLFIDPFPVISPFGEVMVEHTEIDLYDDDGDGIADRGDGYLHTPFIDLDVVARPAD
ncbi:MAG: cytochrome c, partial [Myxococcales bacterium]|nr:cytochrome c [Myxococcales bacterium]